MIIKIINPIKAIVPPNALPPLLSIKRKYIDIIKSNISNTPITIKKGVIVIFFIGYYFL
jgi:hypothetical protein